MGRTKRLLEDMSCHLLDAEYMEWVYFNEQPYYEQQGKQNSMEQNKAPMGIAQDEHGIYTSGAENN